MCIRDSLESAACGILDYPRPGFVSLTKSHSISVARPAISPKRLVRDFGHVRPAHHHRYTRSANRISHSVSLGYHPRHRADTDKFDVLFANESHEVFLSHRARVAVYKQYFMTGWGERLQEKHPEMRHEVA